MPSLKSTENFLEFYIPRVNTSCRTWYKIFNPESDSVPLVVLHGGPGIPHDAVLPISEISWTQNIPVIMYDQIGCGSSSRFPEKMGDGDFWTVDLFLDELDALLTSLGIHERYDLLGHSWGGMIAACHAIKQPHGLRKLVIADSPADMKDWVKAVNHLRAKLPLDVQQALEQCEKDGNIDSDEFEAAAEVYNERHVCRVSPLPEELGRAIRSMKADPTVMLTMYEDSSTLNESP